MDRSAAADLLSDFSLLMLNGLCYTTRVESLFENTSHDTPDLACAEDLPPCRLLYSNAEEECK